MAHRLDLGSGRTVNDMATDPMPVFVYGTLTDPDRAASLLDDWHFVGDVVLEGLRRVEGRYPTLAPGGRTEGRLLVTPQVDRLDDYEGVADGLYVRVALPLADSDRAWVYVGDPDRLDAPADWPGEGPFADRVRRYLADEAVRLRRTGNR